jgi:dihydrolipoamide dehydrogenase
MYDLIIMGGGPAGYLSAERAGALGKSVLLVEASDNLGGVCLNEGCIPTKTLLNGAKLYAHAKDSEKYGVTASQVGYDLAKAMGWKNRVITTLRKGIDYQMRQHNVEVIRGERARLVSRNTVRAGGSDHEGANILVATGGSTTVPPIPGIDGTNVVTSRELLQIDSLPESLAIIGGGYIGMEFASYFSALGVSVTVVEMMEEIIPFMDPSLSSMLRKQLKGVTYELGATVERIEGSTLTYSRNGETHSIDAELILASVGRRPNVADMGFEEAGLDVDRSGVNVNERMETNLPGVYAAGDVTGKSLLAHAAYRMGEVAVSAMFADGERMRYQAIPWVVYTAPEVAGCGFTAAEAEERGIAVETAELPMRVNGRFLAEHGDERGVCKVVVDAKSRALLGVHMLGTGSSEIIYGAAAMIEAELRVQDIKQVVFPHPTVSEMIRDTLWQLE